jgi:hypothetical protein
MSQGGSFLLDPRVRKLRVGLAWDAGVDVDSSAVLLDKDHRVIDVIWFRKLHSNCGSVSHRCVTVGWVVVVDKCQVSMALAAGLQW